MTRLRGKMINRIGLLVPSSNTQVEDDYRRVLPEGIMYHSSRMKVKTIQMGGTLDAILDMNKHMVKAAEELATLPLDLIVYACTSGSFIEDIEHAKKMKEDITSITGVESITPIEALITALREFGIRRVSAVTPYIDTINDRLKVFLQSMGFHVVNIKGLGLTNQYDICSVAQPIILELAREATMEQTEGLLISCTNFPALCAVEAIEKALGIPVVTANQSTLWLALKKLNYTQKISGYGRLFATL